MSRCDCGGDLIEVMRWETPLLIAGPASPDRRIVVKCSHCGTISSTTGPTTAHHDQLTFKEDTTT